MSGVKSVGAQQPIYLDYNATTPIDPRVADAMRPYLASGFGNPSSSHPYGVEAKLAVEKARRQVASLLGCDPSEIVFTSGGSESNNMVIFGIARQLGGRGRHIITSSVEHPAIVEPCAALAAEGLEITSLEVDEHGRVDPRAVAAAIRSDTILVTIMHANNEVGTVQPIAEIAAIARDHGVLMHTDAAQSVGKIPVDVNALGVDFLSVAGHKLYAPKGIGALYVRAGRDLPSLIHGAAHESGRRAGTENVLEIVGLGEACAVAQQSLAEQSDHLLAMRERLWQGLSDELDSLRRNGDPENSLPNTLSVGFYAVEADTLLAEISDRVAASAGAACHADEVDLSAVLEAMAVPMEYAMGTVRFSVGRPTTASEIDEAVTVVVDAVRRLGGAEAPVPEDIEEPSEIKLTRFTHGMGCACKLRPQALEEVLRSVPQIADSSVLVDAATADDAAVYQLAKDLAVVQTVDFFTPITDAPFDFGAVSAANSLSDIYAMGAQPRFALSIVGFPSKRLPLKVLQQILEGAAAVAQEADCPIIGGHTVDDTEPKFGLAVTGTVRPDRVVTNSGAQPGDLLVLTKPIGTGILSTAGKRGLVGQEVAERIVALMRELNRAASEAMVDVGVSACTDVTGFGLLGHLREMAAASRVDVTLDAGAVPLLEPVREMAAAGVVPGGTVDNLAHVERWIDFSPGVGRVERLILADAQTSGGLLIAVAPDRHDKLELALKERGVTEARTIGRFAERGEGRIAV